MQGGYKEAGFDDVLIKPVTLENLKGLLARITPHELPEALPGSDGTNA